MSRLQMRSTLTGLLFVIAATTAIAAEPPGATILGSGFVGAPFVIEGDVVIESNTLYETVRSYADPQAPQVLGWVDHGAESYWTNTVYADGLLVGLTGAQPAGLQGFDVFDATDPAMPIRVGSLSGMGYDSGWLRGHALTVYAEALAVTYDLTVPSTPALTAFSLIGAHSGSRWPGAVGDVLYLIDHAATLRMFNVADPSHPVDLGVAALAGDRIDAMAVGDGHLYALVAMDVGNAGERLDLVTYDLGTPAVPVESNRRTLFTGVAAAGRTLVRSGDLLLAAGSDGQVRAFGLGDPAHPAVGWTLAHDSRHLAISTSAILVRTVDDLYVYGRTTADVAPAPPIQRPTLPLLRNVVGQGPVQVAFRQSDPAGLVTVDVSDPYQPRLGDPIDIIPSGLPQFADGRFLVASGRTGRFFDVADPAHPVGLGWLYGPQFGAAVCKLVTRDLAAFEHTDTTSTVFTVHLFDVSDPALPVRAAVLSERKVYGGDDGLMACGNAAGVRLYDVSNPDLPQLLGSLPDPGALVAVRFWRQHAFAVTTRSGAHTLDIYDLAAPSNPVLVASRALESAPWRLDRHGDRLYIQGYMYFVAFAVTDLDDPQQLGPTHRIISGGTGFAINGNVTTISGDLVTVRNDGLSAAGVDRPLPVAQVVLEPAFPNPCNPATHLVFSLDRERTLAMTVHDVRGRRVAELASGTFSAGPHELTWAGVDDQGVPVSSGVYLVRLHGPGVEAVQTVTLVK